jgi:hypothetical protein
MAHQILCFAEAIIWIKRLSEFRLSAFRLLFSVYRMAFLKRPKPTKERKGAYVYQPFGSGLRLPAVFLSF